jgi:hypothetical protein
MLSSHFENVTDKLVANSNNYSDFESLSKKALEKGLNYFAQGYIHNIKISEARGAIRVDARCWRSM